MRGIIEDALRAPQASLASEFHGHAVLILSRHLSMEGWSNIWKHCFVLETLCGLGTVERRNDSLSRPYDLNQTVLELTVSE